MKDRSREDAGVGQVRGQEDRVVVITDMDYWGDDSNALFMLLGSGRVSVEGIITTSGNVWVEQATINALRILEDANRADIPVYKGMPAQYHEDRLKHYRFEETNMHGTIRYAGALVGNNPWASPTPPPGGPPHMEALAEPGVDYLARTILANCGEITILMIGPATILAQAIRKEPQVAAKVKHVYMMGGAIRVEGNSTPYAEFNFWFDPESAREVVSSGIPATIVTLDAAQGVEFTTAVARRLRGSRQLMAMHVNEYLQRAMLRSPAKLVSMWDELVAGVLLEPSIVLEDRLAELNVATDRGIFYGASTLRGSAADQPRDLVRVISRVDRESLMALFCEFLEVPLSIYRN